MCGSLQEALSGETLLLLQDSRMPLQQGLHSEGGSEAHSNVKHLRHRKDLGVLASEMLDEGERLVCCGDPAASIGGKAHRQFHFLVDEMTFLSQLWSQEVEKKFSLNFQSVLPLLTSTDKQCRNLTYCS